MKRLRKLTGIFLMTAFVLPAFAFSGAALAQQKEKIVVSHPPGFVIGILDFLKAMDPHLKEFNLELSLIPVRGGADNATTPASSSRPTASNLERTSISSSSRSAAWRRH